MRANGGLLAAAAFVGLVASGCAIGHWSAPDALVRPGSPVFFAVSRREAQVMEHSWKHGGSFPTTEVTATRFRAIDARTCHTVRTFNAPEAAHMIAWDGDGNDLWFVTTADREYGVGGMIAHSLSGATIALPPTSDSAVRGTPTRPVQVSGAATYPFLLIWDVHARAVPSLPRRLGPFGVLVDDTRVVVALPGDVTDTTALLVIPRTPGVDVAKAAKFQLAVSGLLSSRGWLFDDAVAYPTTSDLVTFDLRTGAERRALSLPKDGRWRIVDRAHPTLVSLAPAEAGGAAACSSALDVVDIASGEHRQLPLPSCVTNFDPTSDEDAATLLLRGSIDGRDTHWAMQTRSGSVAVPLGPLAVPHVEALGHLVFYVEGQIGSGSLMVADVATGARRAATAPLLSIEDFHAEPASDSIIIKTASGLLAYRVSAGRIDPCDGD